MAQLYMNGEYNSEKSACISPFDRGFLYGDGIFETIKADRGEIEFLAEHIERLNRSARQLNITVPETDWNRVITELLEMNSLDEKTARIKIILTRGAEQGLRIQKCSEPLLLITAAEHIRRRPPERIGIFPEKRLDPVAGHKSLNYLYNLLARDWALHNGLDEAVLTGPEGEILECAASNIFIQRGTAVIKPLNNGYFLEGIMGGHFIKTKKEQGCSVTEKKLLPRDISDSDTVFITNSIIGVCPVKIVKDRTGM